MGSILFEVYNSRMLPIVTGKIGPGHIELPQLWRCAQQMTTKPVKLGMASPEQIGRMLPTYTTRIEKSLSPNCPTS